MLLDAMVALAQIKADKLKASGAAPRDTPSNVVQRLNDEINKAITLTGVVQRVRDAGVEPMAMTVQMFEDFVGRDARRRADLVKLSGARIE